MSTGMVRIRRKHLLKGVQRDGSHTATGMVRIRYRDGSHQGSTGMVRIKGIDTDISIMYRKNPLSVNASRLTRRDQTRSDLSESKATDSSRADLRKGDPFESTAYHEAGHAAVAHYLGLRLTVVRIGPEQNKGFCGYNPPLPIKGAPYQESDTRRLQIIPLAGVLAEKRYIWGFTADIPLREILDNSSDFAAVEDLSEAELMLRLEETDHLLGRLWSGVTELAKALVVCNEIDGDTAAAILTASGVRFEEGFAELMARFWELQKQSPGEFE